MKTPIQSRIAILLEKFFKWVIEMPERQTAWFGSDRFAYGFMGGSVAVLGLFIFWKEVLA